MNHSFYHSALGTLILLSSFTCAIADATDYFSSVATDEKLEYTKWVNARSSAYPRHAYMSQENDKDDGAAIFWNVNGDMINIAIAVRAEGWVGLGISEAGGMIGSDIALFQASNPSAIVDTHVVGDRSMPVTDDCQDWRLEAATAVGEDGWMIVEMSRLINTEDSQDRAILTDIDLWAAPTRIIVAWGDDDSVSYHGAKRAKGSVRIFANYTGEVTESRALLDTLEVESDGFFDVVQNEYDIPASETTYHNLCKTFDELNLEIPQGQSMVTMIGAVPILDEDTVKSIHHFTVSLTKDCSGSDSFDSIRSQSMIYAWAPGDEGMVLPNNVGFPMFHNENHQAVDIQIHYHNPFLISGMKDSSGIRFYYTNDERTHRAGTLLIGDPWMMLYDTQINDGLTKYSFACPRECSSAFIPQESIAQERNVGSQGVTILSEILHMHKTGVRMTNEVIRDGEVFHKAVVDVYDFDQQGGFLTPQETYEVLPGDSFRTTCYYKDGSKFGLSSEDEMCITFITYYPAKDLFGMPWICPYGAPDDGSGCSTELELSHLKSVDDLERSFGASSSECNATPSLDISTSDPPEKSEKSGAAWFGVSFVLQTVSALTFAIRM